MSTKKTFYILDNFFLPTPYNHRFFVEKFARGFEYAGFDVKVIKNVSDIRESGFVMISNHPFYYSFGNRSLRRSLLRSFLFAVSKYDFFGIFRKICSYFKFTLLKSLKKQLAGKEIVVIAWFWNDFENFFIKENIPVIFTGEYFFEDSEIVVENRWKTFYNSHGNALPIKFSADVDPTSLNFKSLLDKKEILLSYIGNASYKPNWYNLFINNQSCKIVATPPYIQELDRLEIYKKSKINLGLHSEDNIRNGVVVERVFEALAYGAVCVTDNRLALLATENNVLVAKDEKDLVGIVDKILDDNVRLLLVEKGLSFIKTRGSYFHRAKEFIDLAHDLYGYEF